MELTNKKDSYNLGGRRYPWRIDVYQDDMKHVKMDREWGAWKHHLGEEFRSILVKHNADLEEDIEMYFQLQDLWLMANRALPDARIKWVHAEGASERGDGRVWLDLDRAAEAIKTADIYIAIERIKEAIEEGTYEL
tara:strand:- start:974 stop:1381 length:408 start_codon:yes stop_codon:yes gene_type:complete